MATIGSRIRKEREEQGLSREEVAKAAGIAKTTLSDLELGRSQSSAALHRLAAVLHVRPEWAETGKGPKHAGEVKSQAARLSGQMILDAYRTATQAIVFMGQSPEDFDPATRIKDAEILARSILAQMAPPGSDGHA